MAVDRHLLSLPPLLEKLPEVLCSYTAGDPRWGGEQAPRARAGGTFAHSAVEVRAERLQHHPAFLTALSC